MREWPLAVSPPWPIRELSDLTTKIGSGATPRGGKEAYVPQGTAFIRSQNVLDSKLIVTGIARITAQAAQDLRNVAVREGDVLLNITGDSITRCCLAQEYVLPARVSQHVAIIRPTAALNPLYLQKFLVQSDFKSFMFSLSSGGTRNALTKAQIERFPIPTPPRPVQDAIAAVLGALDNKIAANDLITNSARAVGRAHFRAAAAEDDAQEIRLASITELISRGVAPRYSEDDSQLRVLNQKCIRDGRISLMPSRRTSADHVAAVKILRPHDILVNSTGVGTLGRVARWTKTGRSTVDSHITIVRFDLAKTDPVCAGFGMLAAEAEIEALGEGSTGQTELSRSQLADLRLVLPSRDRAVQLRPTLDALEERADSAVEESLALAELRDALLPKLMSGEIRVKEAEDAIADAT